MVISGKNTQVLARIKEILGAHFEDPSVAGCQDMIHMFVKPTIFIRWKSDEVMLMENEVLFSSTQAILRVNPVHEASVGSFGGVWKVAQFAVSEQQLVRGRNQQMNYEVGHQRQIIPSLGTKFCAVRARVGRVFLPPWGGENG